MFEYWSFNVWKLKFQCLNIEVSKFELSNCNCCSICTIQNHQSNILSQGSNTKSTMLKRKQESVFFQMTVIFLHLESTSLRESGRLRISDTCSLLSKGVNVSVEECISWRWSTATWVAWNLSKPIRHASWEGDCCSSSKLGHHAATLHHLVGVILQNSWDDLGLKHNAGSGQGSENWFPLSSSWIWLIAQFNQNL